MAHHKTTICLLAFHEAEQLVSLGKITDHKHHQHVSPEEARLLAAGTEYFPWLDDDFARCGQISQSYYPRAAWAPLPDGKFSTQHLVMFSARSWQVVRGSWQFAQLGATATRKHGHTYLRGPRAPQCRIIETETQAPKENK